ncbi:S1C family serine protease [Alkalibacterium sp. 20]|uniref:S1C family serine protease n=1 Tax=Alkalibacterium sp. 20 TaxID=1798803 RepID=UPI00090028C2|nr:trypsin-like peptidase domain-containing protein [Alkalibacterium sp. 20]
MMKKKSFRALLMLSLTSAMLVGCDLIDTETESDPDTEMEENTPVTEEGEVKISEVRVDVTSDITDAVQEVDDAVVSVINMQQVGQDPFGWYEGGQTTDEENLQQIGTGSGAVYKVDGDTAYIFTNNHVVDGSDAIEVLFKDGSRIEATVIGADIWTDLAVLAIDSEVVSKTAKFGDSENLTVGEPAIAIGSPLGTNFASSVTSGIISATERTVPVDTNMDGENDWEMTAIQTDAAINPGNSGGPLVNIAGQVVGINSMKISSSTIEGMGFAIPSNDALDIINQLERNGEMVRPVIGVAMVDLAMVSPQQQQAILNLPEEVTEGIVIAEVQPDSSAEEAGLAANDVIVSFNGEEVANGIELRQEIYDTEVGDEVEIEFYRGGERQTTTITMRSTDDETL